MPNRVGGMDYFYWLFDAECKKLNYQLTWFFPNVENFDKYAALNILCPKENQSIEAFFIDYCNQNNLIYDVVITHFLELCTSFFKNCKPYSKNIIAVDHNPRPLNGYPFKKRMVKKIKGYLYSQYIDLIVGVSQYTKNEIIKDFGQIVSKKTIVVYNGILTSNYKKREERAQTKPKFLVVSHLRESKGIQDLIEAVNLLPEQIKNELKIDLYGEGPYENVLRKNVKENALETVFNFKGSVSNLYDIYAQYDYLLQPTHMECFSLSILESLCSNVPVVTTNVGGNEEAVINNKNGYIFPAKSSIQLSEIIKSVFEGKTSIQEDTSVLIKTNFTIQKMVQNYIDLV